jgi:hypothetical protein
MKLPVNRAEILPIDVSVNLRRRNIGVSQHFLHRAKVGATFQQVSGK